MTKLQDRLSDSQNILRLQLTETEVGLFIRDNVCANCQGDLLTKHAPQRTWLIVCPKCGQVPIGGYIPRYQGTKIEQDKANTLMDLGTAKEPREEDTILNELGF